MPDGYCIGLVLQRGAGSDRERKSGDMTDNANFELSERLRAGIGSFVRRTRECAGTPSDARSETLGLLDRKGPLSAAMVAKARAVTHQSARKVLSDMEVEGLVTGEPSPRDGRERLYRLSEDGMVELRQSRSARTRWIAIQLENILDKDDRETLAAAIVLLERIASSGSG
ncbi:MAG: MarR family transcriptional regulator [Mesorhizobium sp.]|nr:MAG: MarR family transcriptional regulator [Mesorhizobium sp.]RWL26428.1 MAG: MarR family transcriptional regulator [Mesorhizobium sp.]RWL28536.1 MAG: MarR family transcriptional regulator [Mesorhizobium sp.]RWL30043.1 MAG: MarR family transcriptional regulator [Mesorhizobium sp.]RWL45387.1 MAG: MarR family transcriptional regulator [Mesorhizobium sp.]